MADVLFRGTEKADGYLRGFWLVSGEFLNIPHARLKVDGITFLLSRFHPLDRFGHRQVQTYVINSNLKSYVIFESSSALLKKSDIRSIERWEGLTRLFPRMTFPCLPFS